MPRRKPKVIDTPDDYGTTEITHQYLVIPRLTRGSYGYNSKVMDETEIDRLLLKDIINASQHASLERFLKELMEAGFIGVRSPNYEAPVQSDASSSGDRKANIIRKSVAVMKRLERKVGKGRRSALVNLVILDTPWPYTKESLHDCIIAVDDALKA